MDTFCLPPSAYRPVPMIFTEYDSTHLEHCLKQCDYKQIAANTHLFWLAFCKTVSEMQPFSAHFSVKIETRLDQQYIVILGQEGSEFTINKIQKTVEKLSVFFQNSYLFPVTFSPIRINSNYYFRRIMSFANLTDLFPNPKYADHAVERVIFEKYVKPVIPQFSKLLGLSCSITYYQPELREKCVTGWTKTYHCEVIRIEPLNPDSAS
jgi:hypothetical protein